MGDDWTLGDIAGFKNGKRLPEEDPAGAMVVPVYGANGQYTQTHACLVGDPVVVVGRVGAYSGVVHSTRGPAWISDNAIIAEPRPGVCFEYFAYLMKSLDLAATAIGSAQGLITHAGLRSVRVPQPPPLPEQKAIAHILGTLDDKIELNRRMNETLEATARAIFKSWFVDFDPVWAKKEGRQPVGIDAETAALFPDDFEDSELGPIPRGWEVGRLGDVADVVMGQSPDGSTYNEDGVGTPLINGPAQFGDGVPIRDRWTTAPTKLSRAGDLIFCVRGSTGRRVRSDGEYCLGRGVCAVRGRDGMQAFVDLTVDLGIEGLLAAATGTVFSNLSRSDLVRFCCVVPCRALMRGFCDLTEPMRAAGEANLRESRDLATSRDALLPKLMSGELRVGGQVV